MMSLNNTLRSIQPSATFWVKEQAEALLAEGREIIKLGAGELDFNTPQHIVEACIRALREGKTRYTAVKGIPELRREIAIKVGEYIGAEISADEVIVTAGGKQAVYQALAAILNKGDEVIVFSPYWVSYPSMIEILGGCCVPIEMLGNEEPSVISTRLRDAITEKTKAIIVNTPRNPSGSVLSKEMLEAIAEHALENDLFIISDEVYKDMCYDGERHTSIASLGEEIKQRTVIVDSMSKSYAMTGLRVGWAVGTKEVINLMARLQAQINSHAASICQWGALEGLRGKLEFLKPHLDRYWRNIKFAVEAINNSRSLVVPIHPKGAFYIFVSLKPLLGCQGTGATIKNGDEFCAKLLEQAGVAVVPGSAFGDSDSFRISVTLEEEEIKVAIKKIIAFADGCMSK